MSEIIRANVSKIIVFVLAIVALIGVATLLSPSTTYANAKDAACEAIGGSGGEECSVLDKNQGGKGTSLDLTVQNIINLLSAIVAVAAVIMIIIGGFKFVTSGGDANSTKSARNTIIYAVVGLVIVAIAQMIVWFVLTEV